MKSHKKKPHYLNNKEFEKLIHIYIEFQDKDESPPEEVTNKLIDMFYMLIDNIIISFNFSVDTEDAKQDSMVLVLKILSNFRSSSGTAFNYFTTVIVNNLKLIYSKNKMYKQRLEDYLDSRGPIQE